MKIKRFNNLWAMGLILFGAILALVYIAKILFPQWVIGVAQTDRVVQIGNYIDRHQWSYYLYGGSISFVSGYFYLTACCRKNKLDLFDISILIVEIVFLFTMQKCAISYYLETNIFCLILLPTFVCLKDKRKDIKYLYSIVTCFMIHSLSQIISLEIRDISLLLSHPNSATITILIIDTYIWQFLLHNYFNFKEIKTHGTS